MKIRRSLPPLALSGALLLPVTACGGEGLPEENVAEEVEPAETDPVDIDPDAAETTGAAEDGGTATETDGTATATETGQSDDGQAAGDGPIELVETSYDISVADTPGDEEPLTVAVPAPGTYTFRVTNESGIVHALEVEGHGVHAVTPDIPAGEIATLEVELPEAGEYDLYCPVANHKELGMDGSVVVSGG